jgi:integrase
LQKAVEARVRLLETALQPSPISHYRRTAGLFLSYLNDSFPEVRKPSHLRRDPHLLGWLEHLWKLRTSKGGPLDSGTRGQHVLRMRTLLELPADAPQPPLAGLLRSDDVPPRQHRLPRPLTPEDDARLQAHWAGATDLLHCALLLQRLTGMRIGECVDLAPDCLRHLGDNRWSLPPAADPRFLLPRPTGRGALLASLRETLRSDAGTVGVQSHIVPHRLAIPMRLAWFARA